MPVMLLSVSATLRQLRTILSMLTKETTVTLIRAISSRLDYCNSLLYGISSTLLRRLQSIQNAAARLVTGAKKFDHITPVLRELHWLPIRINCHSWCTRACTTLHQSTSAVTVYRYHHWPGDDNCVPLSVAPWTVSGQELFLVVARVQSVRPCDVERSADRTAYCYCVPRRFRQKTENLFVREQLLRAH